ncbi:unnamed protein product [Soboliphyme baturini]|uniref:PH domain-containing protein n=1 Tax=Soboliphyme baturini TaxID=241478 RepID=A0A183JAB9_9BILA|nr:unnamed protein product [Soboliphyme baturini]
MCLVAESVEVAKRWTAALKDCLFLLSVEFKTLLNLKLHEGCKLKPMCAAYYHLDLLIGCDTGLYLLRNGSDILAKLPILNLTAVQKIFVDAETSTAIAIASELFMLNFF